MKTYRYLGAYLMERFPPLGVLLFAVLYLASRAISAQAAGLTFRLSGADFLGILAVSCFFYRLRVFDEYKDYPEDLRNHPHRVLQSGKITLAALGALAWGGAGLEAAWSLMAGGTACLLWWGIAVSYSLAMRYEFGISDWLKPRLVWYALSHMAIMPLVICWVWASVSPVSASASQLGLLLVMSLAGGFSFEVARKIHAPEAERATVPGYSALLGLRGAVLLLGTTMFLGAAALSWLLGLIGAPAWAIGLVWGLAGGALAVYSWGIYRPREKIFRRAELLVSLSMAASYLLLFVFG